MKKKSKERSMGARLIDADAQAIVMTPCLDSLLMLVSGRRGRMLRAKPRLYGDGQRNWFTRLGAKTYSRLTEILFAASRLTGKKNIAGIIDELDSLATREP